MVVQHNLTAMNSSRQLGIVTNAQAKQAEKLSSGYRINRAGDDAAGLKISEKMRSQIRGLQKASTNAQDGVSLIQTAEGALNEAHSILQRMNELTIQGANDTNENIDRDAIKQELDALTTELDRIASTTQFNKQNLLDGNYVGKKLQVGANTNQSISITITAMNATAIGLNDAQTVTYNWKEYTYGGTEYATLASANDARQTAIDAISSVDARITAHSNGSNKGVMSCWKVGATSYATLDSAKAVAQSAYDAEVSAISAVGSVAKNSTQTVTAPTVSDYQKAQATLSKIQAAINKVSNQRSALGAIQNRLEHTIANLDNVSENTQAGQSMLAQANQSTQGVLSLLQ